MLEKWYVWDGKKAVTPSEVKGVLLSNGNIVRNTFLGITKVTAFTKCEKVESKRGVKNDN